MSGLQERMQDNGLLKIIPPKKQPEPEPAKTGK